MCNLYDCILISSCMYCILYAIYIGEFIENGLAEYGIISNIPQANFGFLQSLCFSLDFH